MDGRQFLQIRGLWSLVAGSRRSLKEWAGSLAPRSLAILDPADRVSFLESEIRTTLGLRRVEILQRPEGPERFSSHSSRIRDSLSRVTGALKGIQRPYLSEALCRGTGASALLRTLQATYAVPVEHGGKVLGLLIIDSAPRNRLDRKSEALLLPVAAQLAVVLENSNLLRSKLELQDTLARQAGMAALGEMTARIAHEIKNPLSSMKIILQVMREDPWLRSPYERDLDLLTGEIDRLAQSVTRLLCFARPATGADQPVRLSEVAAATVDFLRRDFESEQCRLMSDIPDDLPCVPGRPELYREVLLNLLHNAIQAGGSGTTVSLQAWPGVLEDVSEKFVLLVVEDDGPGIPEEIQAKVFTPFFTTRTKGTGLGLAIVKRNIEHVGGHIRLESPAKHGRGTRFLIHLPLARE